jgi:hypothetical protein
MLSRASANEHRRGPSTPRYKARLFAIDLRSASLRMTALSGVEIQLVGYAENTKRSKVTGSQDDDSVGALQYRQSEAVSAILEEDQTHHLREFISLAALHLSS